MAITNFDTSSAGGDSGSSGGGGGILGFILAAAAIIGLGYWLTRPKKQEEKPVESQQE